MPDKYRNKYRIDSIRLKKWDNRWNGKYIPDFFTHKIHHLFGKIVNGKMMLSNVGMLADIFWNEIKKLANNLEPDAFVVMPNHIHSVIEHKNNLI